MKKLLLLLQCFVLASSIYAQKDLIPFDSIYWDLSRARLVEHLGRESMMGTATLKDVEFENGIIEFDMAVNGDRSYPGIKFRQQSPGNCESFYIRPHVSKRPDALQYIPDINGKASWQLYHGEGYTAAGAIPQNQWLHVKLLVSGSRAEIYFNNMENAAFDIYELGHGVSKGAISIYGPANGSVHFSNFTYQKKDDISFKPIPDFVDPIGLVKDWKISEVMKLSDVDNETYPAPDKYDAIQWQSVKADKNGLVDISKYKRSSLNGEPDCIYGRTIINSDEERVQRFNFGYSDVISIFINGQIVFTGNSIYKSRSVTYLGGISLQDAVYLPLQKGDNEIFIIISEARGGWGFMFQDAEADYMHESVKKAWEVPTGLKMPESAVYDKKRDVLYISNYFGGGNEFISKLNTNGEILDLKWVSGFVRPTGMYIYKNELYVVERTGVAVIDIDKGTIVKRYPVERPRFLNDISFDKDGNAYISDNGASRILQLKNGNIDVWLESEELAEANAIFVDGDKLIAGNCQTGCLKSVDLNTKEIKNIACLGYRSNIDGIKRYDKDHYLVSDYNGRLLKVSNKGVVTELLNLTVSGGKCADFEYIEEQKLIVIPSLFFRKLYTYKIK